MKKNLLLMLLFAAAAFASCKAESSSEQENRNISTYALNGKIDYRSLTDFKQELSRSRISVIVVNSRGGRIPEAIEFGKLILAHNISVTVKGECLSACASYLFSVSPRRTVVPGSNLLYHQTAAGMEAQMLASDRPALASVYREVAAAERKLYRSAGIDDALLAQSFRAMEPHCYVVNDAVPRESEYRTLYKTRYRMLMPSSSWLKSYGITFQGAIPSSKQEYVANSIRLGSRPLEIAEEHPQLDFDRIQECDMITVPTKASNGRNW